MTTPATPLSGLSGLYPDPQDTGDYMDEGVLEAKANPIDPEHSQYGSQSVGYQGTDPTASPYSGQQVYEGWAYNDGFSGRDYDVFGIETDQTPDTHNAAYPRGIIQPSWDNPDAWADVGTQINVLHSVNLGGIYKNIMTNPAGHEEQTDYTTDDYVAPNENYLASDIPGQLRQAGNNGVGASGHGNADPTQGYGVLNTLPEFNAGHSIRRIQHDRMPWDFSLLHGEQDVPFPARHPVQQMPLNGPDSPYFEAGSIDGANIVWEGRIGDPTQYQQPAEVTVNTSLPEAPDLYAWG